MTLSPIYCFQRKKKKERVRQRLIRQRFGQEWCLHGLNTFIEKWKPSFFFAKMNIRLPHILIFEFESSVRMEPKMWNFTVETTCWWSELLIIDFIYLYNIFFNPTLREVRPNVQFFLFDESLVELSNHMVKNNSLAICFSFLFFSWMLMST